MFTRLKTKLVQILIFSILITELINTYMSFVNLCIYIHGKSERFLRKPKRVLLYDPQKHHLKALRSHL